MADGEACGALMLKQQEEALRGDVRRPVPARLFRSTSVLPQTTALDVWAAVGGRWFAKFEGCVQAYVEGKK